MGLCKSLYTKRCDSGKLSIAEMRFCGLRPWPKESPKKKDKVPQKSNEEFITDMLKGLL